MLTIFFPLVYSLVKKNKQLYSGIWLISTPQDQHGYHYIYIYKIKTVL